MKTSHNGWHFLFPAGLQGLLWEVRLRVRRAFPLGTGKCLGGFPDHPGREEAPTARLHRTLDRKHQVPKQTCMGPPVVPVLGRLGISKASNQVCRGVVLEPMSVMPMASCQTFQNELKGFQPRRG